MKDQPFYREAELLIRIMPLVSKEDCFALKGGTAINFFWRDMPRLSVDIDLTFLPILNREESFDGMSSTLERIAKGVESMGRDFGAHRIFAKDKTHITKLIVYDLQSRITIEPNEVLRGFVYEPVKKRLCQQAQDIFEMSVSVKTLSFPDLYGGKICAALDRQHPRDIFDMKLLLDNEGITTKVRKAFVVYLSSHDRPINEMFNPKRKDISQAFEKQFLGMTTADVSLDELLAVREKYIHEIASALTDEERKFLVSLKEGRPAWSLLGLEGIEKLPALQWKLKNILTLKSKDPRKHIEQLNKLRKCLEL